MPCFQVDIHKLFIFVILKRIVLPVDASHSKQQAKIDCVKIPNWIDFLLHVDPYTSTSTPTSLRLAHHPMVPIGRR